MPATIICQSKAIKGGIDVLICCGFIMIDKGEKSCGGKLIQVLFLRKGFREDALIFLLYAVKTPPPQRNSCSNLYHLVF